MHKDIRNTPEWNTKQIYLEEPEETLRERAYTVAGIAFALGAGLGTVFGAVEGASKPSSKNSSVLRENVWNGITKHALFFGTKAASVGLVCFVLLNSFSNHTKMGGA
ncbi:MAG: uncharacterized protein A8A55_0467 [Amphiamblys sp. WSBS2006]|nr:MAG: uncharacterized protein A8A55_0467 [Amphiamblys sp. WSBS2006]